MTTEATSTQGVQLKLGSTAIAEVKSFKGPGTKAPQIDVSHFGSTAVDRIAGLKDMGDFSFEVNFIGSNAQQQALIAAVGGAAQSFTLVLNDDTVSPTQYAFSALVTGFEITGAVNQVISASITLTITGPGTYTFAT